MGFFDFFDDKPNSKMSPRDILDLDISLNEIGKNIPKYRDALEKNLIDKHWIRSLLDKPEISEQDRQNAINMLTRDKMVHEGYATGRYPISGITGDVDHHKKWMNAYDVLINRFKGKP